MRKRHIDRFSSNLATPERASAKRTISQPTQSPQHKLPQRYDVFSAQSSAGAVVVPSARTGTLPEELRHIRSTPGTTVIGDRKKRKIPKAQYPAKKRSMFSGRDALSRSPVQSSKAAVPKNDVNAVAVDVLRQNINQSAAQLDDMKHRLENAELRRAEDQDFTERKLDDIRDLILDKEKENKKCLEDIQHRSQQANKQRVVVETIVDECRAPFQYKVMSITKPIKESPSNTPSNGIAFQTIPNEKIILLHEPPIEEARREEENCNHHARLSRIPVSNTTDLSANLGRKRRDKEGEMIVFHNGVSNTVVKNEGIVPSGNKPAIFIAEPSTGIKVHNSGANGIVQATLPKLLPDNDDYFDSSGPHRGLSQHNRPLQPWTSRVKINKPIEKKDEDISGAVIDLPVGGSSDIDGTVPTQGSTSDQINANGQKNCLNADTNPINQSLMDLVKGMVIHQQSTIESQAELMRAVLLARDKSSAQTLRDNENEINLSITDDGVCIYPDTGVSKNSDDLAAIENIDMKNGQAEPVRRNSQSNMRTVQVAEDSRVVLDRMYKSSFGRLLAMGREFGSIRDVSSILSGMDKPAVNTIVGTGNITSADGIPSAESIVTIADIAEEMIVRDTLYGAAEKAMYKRQNEINSWVNEQFNGDNKIMESKQIVSNDQSGVMDRCRFEGGSNAMESTRVASLNTVKYINQLRLEQSAGGLLTDVCRNPHKKTEFSSTGLSSQGVPVGVQFMNDILSVIHQSVLQSVTYPPGKANINSIDSCPPGSNRRGVHKKGFHQEGMTMPVDDPRCVEQHLIEECVERAIRATLPPQLLNHSKRVVGYGSEVNRDYLHEDRNDEIDDERYAKSMLNIRNDTEQEWTDHDLLFNRNNKKNSVHGRPTGGFPGRIRTDLSGDDIAERHSDNEAVKFSPNAVNIRKVVAGPGGLVYYGDRDNWDSERCMDQKQYKSYKDSQIPYQRYINRNGMNHSVLTEPTAENHYRGSDEEGHMEDDGDLIPMKPGINRAAKPNHDAINADIVRHLQGGMYQDSTRKDKAKKLATASGDPSPCNNGGDVPGDVHDIINRDMQDLKAYRNHMEEAELNETRSSISEYSSGNENGFNNPNKRFSRVPPEAIALDYERRANQKQPKEGIYTVAEDQYESMSKQKKLAGSNLSGRSLNHIPYSSYTCIPTPLVSKQLGHDATAEIATMGFAIDFQPKMYREGGESDDSEAEANVLYPSLLATNYHAMPTPVHSVAGRRQQEPRSRFLHNLEAVSDESMDGFDSSLSESNHKRRPTPRRIKTNSNVYSQTGCLGNRNTAHRTKEIMSACSSGTSDSDTSVTTASSYEKENARHTSRRPIAPTKEKSNKNSVLDIDDEYSISSTNNSKSKERIIDKKHVHVDDSMLRQPIEFVSKLRLEGNRGIAPGSENEAKPDIQASYSSKSSRENSVVSRVGLGGNSQECSEVYYTSMDSDVTISSTSEDVEILSGARWGTRR